jgi:uncharacterized small protein (DUF1192 family)
LLTVWTCCAASLRAKLDELEQLYTKTASTPAADEHVRDLTLRSLKKRINQFREEIARFEARATQTANE